MTALLSRDRSREGHRGQCSFFLNHIWEANTMHWCVTAQFKPDICTHMVEEFLEKIHEILMSSHTQNSFYHFRTLVTHATFDLLAVAAFLMSSNIPTAD